MLRFLSFLAAVFFAQAGTAGECSRDVLQLQGVWGQAEFNVEIADTGELRARGLMHRESMPQRDGMLFVFDQPRPTAFWMRNTLIPLDMLFATRDGVVQRIHENAIPLDETLIPGGPDIMYVLEINGGLSNLYGISEGTMLRHPLIDQNEAAWPC